MPEPERNDDALRRRRRLRDALLVSLTFSTGMVDALSYLGLGQIFTANMTGNTVFFALAIGEGNAFTAARSVIALAGFAGSAFLAGRRLGPVIDPDPWPRTVTRILALEALFLAVFAAVWQGVGGAPDPGVTYGLVAVSALGMGMQSAVGRRLAVPGMSTNVLTMALTGLMAELAAVGISGPNERRWAFALLAMGSGAALGAVMFHLDRPLLPWAIFAVVAAVGLAAALGSRREGTVGATA